jgi:hypothetical protein
MVPPVEFWLVAVVIEAVVLVVVALESESLASGRW